MISSPGSGSTAATATWMAAVPEVHADARHVFHLYVVRVANRDELRTQFDADPTFGELDADLQGFFIGLGDVTGDGTPELLALDNELAATYRAFVFDIATGTAASRATARS